MVFGFGGAVKAALGAQADAKAKGAMVTAAAQGIGRGCAEQLAAGGYCVLCCDLERQREAAQATVEAIRAAGGRADFFACDVTDSNDLAAAVARTVELYGSLDASVAVVGGNGPGGRMSVLECTAETYERTIALTQHATFYQTQYSARQMVAQGAGGSIVIIGSIMADYAFRTAGAYTMAKCAIRQLAKVAALELAPHNVRVNVVQPGYINTPGERQVASEEELANSAKCLPLQRLGRPDDVGNMVAFLCSAGATYVTGTCVDVDGGFKVALALPGHTQDNGSGQAQ